MIDRRRILIAECKQEVSTFNPHLSGVGDFTIRTGPALFDYHRTVHTEIGGALRVLEAQPDIELIPAYGACLITSGGTLAKADWEQIASDFIQALEAAPQQEGRKRNAQKHLARVG